jgi:hypothetical protein
MGLMVDVYLGLSKRHQRRLAKVIPISSLSAMGASGGDVQVDEQAIWRSTHATRAIHVTHVTS